MTYRVGLFFRMTSRAALWIDESPMNLCEILGFQPKGANALSFSSRERPAYAGMTVRGIWTMLGYRWGCCHLSPLPLWIADQVRNDGVVMPRPVDTALKPV